jgi:hypothetical protein
MPNATRTSSAASRLAQRLQPAASKRSRITRLRSTLARKSQQPVPSSRYPLRATKIRRPRGRRAPAEGIAATSFYGVIWSVAPLNWVSSTSPPPRYRLAAKSRYGRPRGCGAFQRAKTLYRPGATRGSRTVVQWGLRMRSKEIQPITRSGGRTGQVEVGGQRELCPHTWSAGAVFAGASTIARRRAEGSNPAKTASLAPRTTGLPRMPTRSAALAKGGTASASASVATSAPERVRDSMLRRLRREVVCQLCLTPNQRLNDPDRAQAPVPNPAPAEAANGYG